MPLLFKILFITLRSKTLKFMKTFSHLLNKSDLLLTATNYLHDKVLYPAVAHCSYYSCYQFYQY